ncbi:MAG: RNA methyltransferase [Lachnospiraceae bacterium]|nr:RNA methyltransferase [Lachnospiraceae bacterium]
MIELQKKSKSRMTQNVYIIEGEKLFIDAPHSSVQEVYLTAGFLQHASTVVNLSHKLSMQQYEVVSDDVFRRMSDTMTPQGILCVVKREIVPLEIILEGVKGEQAWKKGNQFQSESSAPLWLLLEDINDPGNLGTIIRTAEAIGIDAIILSANCVDVYNPKTVRAAMGSIFRTRISTTTSITSVIDILRENEVTVYAAKPSGVTPCYDCDFWAATAFLIGSESHGLREDSCRNTIDTVIPMKGEADSINVAVASSILLYEAARQRGGNKR